MKVSIITVCYNSESVISSAIHSVLSQSFPNIEYIIIDGSSKDDTVSIIQSYGDKISHFVSEPDSGIYDAMNKGLAMATGDVVGILNSDDFYCHNDVIKSVVEVFESNSNIEMVLGNVDYVSSSNLSKPVRYYSSFNFKPWKMRFGFMPAHPASFIKRSAYNKVGNYNLGYRIGADFDMFNRMLVVEKMLFKTINQTFVRMRLGGVSTSGFNSYRTITKEMLQSLKENKVYSNILFVLIRLPIKYFQQLLFKIRMR